MKYQCEATSIAGFLQQLSVAYIGHGYWLYTSGEIPRHKDPRPVDEKFIHRYRLNVSRSERSRRKTSGQANVHYIRYEHFFVLVATTTGRSSFFDDEPGFRDFRSSALHFGAYSVSHRGGHPHVRLSEPVFKEFRAVMLELAIRHSAEELEAEFRRYHYEPYAPVRGQVLSVWGSVNAKRKTAGLNPVRSSCLYLWRRPCKPFEIMPSACSAAQSKTAA